MKGFDIMLNVNEVLKDGLYDLVVDITCGGAILEDGFVIEGAWENGKLVTYEDLLMIVNNNQVKRFLELEMKDNECGNAKIKTLLKGYLLGSGLKLDNAMIVRIFNIVKEIVNDMKDLSNKDKDTLQEIKEKTNIVCTDLLQFALVLERYLLGLQEDFDLDLNEVVLGAIQEYFKEE